MSMGGPATRMVRASCAPAASSTAKPHARRCSATPRRMMTSSSTSKMAFAVLFFGDGIYGTLLMTPAQQDWNIVSRRQVPGFEKVHQIKPLLLQSEAEP